MELALPALKTDPFRKGIKLTIAATQDEGCPVEAMKRFQERDTHRPATAPLFGVGQHTSNQRPFSREYVVSKLQPLARIAGLSQESWNGHSFRRGAATSAAQAGMSEAEIQILGRWKSDSYKSYIEYPRKQGIALSARFQQPQPQIQAQ